MTDDKEQFEAMLADYVDGNLGGAELREAEAYLDAHPDVRIVLQRLALDSERVRSLPRVAAPVDVSEDFYGQVERDLLLGEAGVAPRRPRTFTAPVAAIAAILMVALGMSGVAYWLLAKRPTPFLDYAMRSDERSQDRSVADPTTDVTPLTKESTATANWGAGVAAKDQGERGKMEVAAAAVDVRARSAARPEGDEQRQPQLTLAAPTSGDSSLAAAPNDVAALFAARRSPNRRGVVLIVQPAAHADAALTDREVDAALATLPSANAPHPAAPDALAGGAGVARVGAGPESARPPAENPSVNASPTMTSNTFDRSALADAIASSLGEPAAEESGVRVLRGVSDADLDTLQSTLRGNAVVSTLDGYALPAPGLPTGLSFDKVLSADGGGVAASQAASDVTTAPTAGRADESRSLPELDVRQSTQQASQQVSGEFVPRLAQAGAKGDADAIDVFVVVRPPTTVPATTARSTEARPTMTTQPATTRAAG